MSVVPAWRLPLGSQGSFLYPPWYKCQPHCHLPQEAALHWCPGAGTGIQNLPEPSPSPRCHSAVPGNPHPILPTPGCLALAHIVWLFLNNVTDPRGGIHHSADCTEPTSWAAPRGTMPHTLRTVLAPARWDWGSSMTPHVLPLQPTGRPRVPEGIATLKWPTVAFPSCFCVIFIRKNNFRRMP